MVAVLTATSYGCAGGRISLGTGANACFRALPTAQDVVHHQGRLVGVRRFNTSTLRARLPNGSSTLPPQDVCAFAFDGSYPPGSVTGAHNPAPARYAIVDVSYNHPDTVVAAFTVDHLPTRFRHLH
jgi:hypothetical protein